MVENQGSVFSAGKKWLGTSLDDGQFVHGRPGLRVCSLARCENKWRLPNAIFLFQLDYHLDLYRDIKR